MPRRTAIRAVTVLLSALLAVSAAQADQRDWAPALTEQILDEHQCVVAFLSQVVEREVDGIEVVIAKTHCEDGRAFDIYREGVLRSFEIIECEVPNQETC